jgi:hypothetical protein
MPITKDQALTANEFHNGECRCIVGPRGGKTVRQEVWRRNGQTQTWKTRPLEFSVPVKFGLKSCARLNQINSIGFHTAEECPLRGEV